MITAFTRSHQMVTILWFYQGTFDFVSSPALNHNEDIVYCGNTDSNLYAISSTTGSVIWIFHTTAAITSSPYVHGQGFNETIYVASTDYIVYSVNATSGIFLKPIGFVTADSSSPVIYNEALYIGSIDHAVYALSTHSSYYLVLWRFMTDNQIRY